jgi:hypothetical protein
MAIFALFAFGLLLVRERLTVIYLRRKGTDDA